jgi:hypothetical protein
VAPPEIVEVLVVGLVVEDQAALSLGLGDRDEVLRSGQRRTKELAALRLPVERGQEIGDPGGAVGEVRHEPGKGRVHGPLEAAVLGPAELGQA